MSKAPFVFLTPDQAVTAWWPCPVSVPVDPGPGEDPGTRETQVLTLRFQVLSDVDIAAALKGGVTQLLMKATLDWRLLDGAGAPVPFERFSEVIAVPYAKDGCFEGYMDFLGRGPTKN